MVSRSDDGAGTLASPPSHVQRATLPEDFGRRFLLFVDTEEEFDWDKPFSRDAIATTAMTALPDAHQRFRDWGIAPNYMADYPVVTDPRSRDILRGLVEDGSAHVGAQLHPWVTPPFSEAVSVFNSFPGNLPKALEREKIQAITQAIEDGVGTRPIAYRAGRYGVGPNSAQLLLESGYQLDVSTRPLFDYRKGHGPDFTGFPMWPWWVDDAHRLLELPLAAGWAGWGHRAGHALYAAGGAIPFGRSVLARTNMLHRVALTPEGTPLALALESIKILFDQGVTLFSLSCHSPSLQPGHTPYVRDRADLAAFWRWWDGVLALFAQHKVLPASAQELLNAVQR